MCAWEVEGIKKFCTKKASKNYSPIWISKATYQVYLLLRKVSFSLSLPSFFLPFPPSIFFLCTGATIMNKADPHLCSHRHSPAAGYRHRNCDTQFDKDYVGKSTHSPQRWGRKYQRSFSRKKENYRSRREPNGWRERKFQAMGTRDKKNQKEEGPWHWPQGQQVPAPSPLRWRQQSPSGWKPSPKIKQKGERHPKLLSTSY